MHEFKTTTMEKKRVVGTTYKDTTESQDENEWDILERRFSGSAEKRLLHRVDMRILPVFFVIYLVSHVDRTNIGNAKLLGLEKSLHLSDQQFNWYFLPPCRHIAESMKAPRLTNLSSQVSDGLFLLICRF